MLELKKYQKRSLEELKNFLINASTLKGERGIRLAYLDQVGDEERHYKPITGLEEAPYICIKIPTGGGKTLVASHSLPIILNNYLQYKNGKGLVMWFVPSDAIRSQTLDALKDRNHPYREALDAQFGNSIKVLALEEALSIQKTDTQDNLCIVVASLQAFRRTDKQWLKVFQNNGSLLSHFENLIEDTNFLDKDEEDQIIYSLGNVIKVNNPIVILDEGHNAQTFQSYEMLTRLNPSFILEFTATPRSESNVLVKVLATELKAERMVKIPIYLSNVTQWQEAIRDGVEQRKKLETLANKERKLTKEYLRPIILLQAEREIEDESKIHVAKIKQFLQEDLEIDESEIKIKTAKTDEIKNINLLSSSCPVRYIITVNALKEGWDCPFAYILVSVANIGATISVEQTIGRILRLPNAVEKKNLDLNYSFIYTSSENFSKASSAIIKGLEDNGYSEADLRENKGKVVAEKTKYSRLIKDKDIKVPLIGLRQTKEQLAFNKDLIGEKFMIYDHYKNFDIDFHEDQNQKVKIDIDKKTGIYRITQGKLFLTLYPEDFSIEELGNWLKRSVRSSVVSSLEMTKYIDLALTHLIKTHSIEELSLNRFRLKEQIQKEIAQIIEVYAKKSFDDLLQKKEVNTKTVFYTPPLQISLTRFSSEHFKRHLFETAGYMNGEETELALRMDSLENIAWWYRNREKEDFHLQGWKPSRFYPDFIIKTKKGAIVVAEYKGEDRLSNEDTGWKKELGILWEKLCNKQNRFFLVSKDDLDNTLKAVSSL